MKEHQLKRKPAFKHNIVLCEKFMWAIQIGVKNA